jgi:hypothetical protein
MDILNQFQEIRIFLTQNGFVTVYENDLESAPRKNRLFGFYVNIFLRSIPLAIIG